MISGCNSQAHVYTDRSRKIIELQKLHKKSNRKEISSTLIEGYNSVSIALTMGLLQEVLITESGLANFGDFIQEVRKTNIPVSIIDYLAQKKLADTQSPTGIFGVATIPAQAEFPQSGSLITVLCDVQDPTNVGAIIRTSDAMGADYVILTGECADPWGSKVVRASAGSVFSLPIHCVDDGMETIKKLQSQGIICIATSGYAKTLLPEIETQLVDKTAWFFGNEAHGLSNKILQHCDYAVSIPLQGNAESLNVASVAAICLYESAKAQAH